MPTIFNRGSSRRRGFTLVELLVVIGIIALLISILLPALSKARKSAVKVKCANNLRSVFQLFAVYAAENKGFLPCGIAKNVPSYCNWDWDVPIATRNLMVGDGGNRKIYYCPSFPDQNNDTLWNWTTNYSVWGYVLYFDRGGSGVTTYPNHTNPQSLIGMSYQTKISPMQPFYDATNGLQSPGSSADTVLGADATPSNSTSNTPVRGSFHVQGGWSAEDHQSSHMGDGGMPEGGNVLFMDGHVIFRRFDEMQRRTNTFPYWWF